MSPEPQWQIRMQNCYKWQRIASLGRCGAKQQWIALRNMPRLRIKPDLSPKRIIACVCWGLEESYKQKNIWCMDTDDKKLYMAEFQWVNEAMQQEGPMDRVKLSFFTIMPDLTRQMSLEPSYKRLSRRCSSIHDFPRIDYYPFPALENTIL